MLTPEGYKSRIIDSKIDQLMTIYGAVCVEGPKWCGKTWTSGNHAASASYIGDPAGNFMNKQLAEMDPAMILEGKFPRLIDASPELRSKKDLIETFISGINDVDDVMIEWHDYVAEEREKQLAQIITEEHLKEDETRRFLENAFRDGEIRTTGTDIDRLMPPVTRFGGGKRAEKKQTIIDKLKAFFERFFGIGGSSFKSEVRATSPIGIQQSIVAPGAEEPQTAIYEFTPQPMQKVAENKEEYGAKK